MAPTLIAENIHKSFGDNVVLKGISIKAEKGDVISMIGSSGSGKSTFLRCINLLEVPDQGRVVLGNNEINLQPGHKGLQSLKRRQVEQLRTGLGMVFQNFNLWSHLSVLDNVTEGPLRVLKRDKQEIRDEALSLLDKVGIADKHDSYPAQLSGGQQQRVAIARALAMQPEVLLFDEPTSALDPELVGEVLKVMRALADEGRTMIVVTHEMGFAREVSNRSVFLHQGRVEESGTPAQVFDNPVSERCRQFLQSVI